MTADPRFMRLALEEAYKGIAKGEGGPFGACIVRRGRVVAVGHNRVLAANDPTLHAEVCAIQAAAKDARSFDFSGCEIYSTTEPCVMCFAAINWARMDRVHFGTTVMDVARLGFNELTISNRTLKRLGRSRLALDPGFLRGECLELLGHWKSLPKKRTY